MSLSYVNSAKLAPVSASTKPNLTGVRFGSVVALGPVAEDVWACRCDCGNGTLFKKADLLHIKSSISCGCLLGRPFNTEVIPFPFPFIPFSDADPVQMPPVAYKEPKLRESRGGMTVLGLKNFTGFRSTFLTVLGNEIKTDHNKVGRYFVCACFCGNIISVRRGDFSRGEVRSCGCIDGTPTTAEIVDAPERQVGQVTRMPDITIIPVSELQPTEEDITGQVFFSLTVIGPTPRVEAKTRLWACRCECGNVSAARSTHLKNKATRSCGCRVARPTSAEIVSWPSESVSKAP